MTLFPFQNQNVKLKRFVNLQYQIIYIFISTHLRVLGTLETLRRDCPFSQLTWIHLNGILEERNLGLDKIVSYENIFDFINEFIQIERPKLLMKSKILTLINLLMNTEKYIAIRNQKFEKLKRGGPFL